jgi:hypothetical protein
MLRCESWLYWIGTISSVSECHFSVSLALLYPDNLLDKEIEAQRAGRLIKVLRQRIARWNERPMLKPKAKEVLRVNPKFSLEAFNKRRGYKNVDDWNRLVDVLRKAGLIACQIRSIKGLDISPKKAYLYFNFQTIQSSGKLLA